MPQLRDTLVIVDMQPLLPASNPDWLRQAVLGLIARANATDMAIIVLEYMSLVPLCYYGKTYDELIVAARLARHFAMRAKAHEDGSARVAAALESMDLTCNRFVVCGINTHACVEATAIGLTKLFPQSLVEVVASACNDRNGNNWPSFARRPNLVLVQGK